MSAPPTAALEAAQAYVARGWNPIPLPFRSKKPTGDEWQKRVIVEADIAKYFNGRPQNIGVILGPTSNGLTDVDLDCDEAITLASHVLPKTGAIFGRKSAPASHWLFRTKTIVTTEKAVVKFLDPTRPANTATMLELRVGDKAGVQTVFPGSVHDETGEEIRWDENGAEAEVDGDDLLKQCCLLASICLFARHWPGVGARHEAALSLGGFLARAGLKAPQVKYLVEAIARAAGDNEPQDRRDTAEDAAQEFHAGRPARGYPLLAETFGDKVAKRVAEWLDYRGSISDDDTSSGSSGQPSAGIGNNSKNQLRLYAEVAEELFRRMNARNEDLRIVTDEKGNEHSWRYRDGLWSLMLKPGPWVEHQIEMTLREMKLRSASTMKFIAEARKYIERSPDIRTSEQIIWDDHGKIPTRGGLIDPVTLTIEPFRKEHYATWRLDVDYDPTAVCPLWLELLNDYFPDHSSDEREARVMLLQDFAGTTLIDRLPKALKRALVLLGASDTGKSTLLRVLWRLLTDKPISTPLSEVSGPHGLQEFMRRAPWVLDEAFDIGVWHLSAKVKSIISGDTMSINPKNAPPITMRINCPAIWGTNHPATFRENTDAIINRLLVVKLARVFDKDNTVGVAAKAKTINPAWEPDDLILDREKSGLLNWALIGLQRVLERGNFINTAEGISALEDMKLEANPVAGFIRDCIDFDNCMMTSTVDFYAAFTSWRQENHGDDKASFSPSFVGKNLAALAHPRIAQDKQAFRKEDGTRFYIGITLNKEGRAHFDAMAMMQDVNPTASLKRMSNSAAEASHILPSNWTEHPEVVKLWNQPARETPDTLTREGVSQKQKVSAGVKWTPEIGPKVKV